MKLWYLVLITGLIKHNSLAGIKDAFITPAKTNLPTLKPYQLSELMRAVYNANIRQTTRNLILFQLHTMARPTEASGALWQEIDTDKKLWTIPSYRMKRGKEHIVPLTDQVIAILLNMKEINKYSEYVFAGDRNINQPTNSSTANVALKRMGFKGLLVAHGLRSLASTTLNEREFDAEMIEVSLSHIDKNTVRSAYNRASYIDRRRKMMQWWSDHIDKAMTDAFTLGDCKNSAPFPSAIVVFKKSIADVLEGNL